MKVSRIEMTQKKRKGGVIGGRKSKQRGRKHRMNVTKSGGQRRKVPQGRNRGKSLKNRRVELEEARKQMIEKNKKGTKKLKR